MEELQKELKAAFEAICRVAVSGDSVDLIVIAKQHLKKAYGLVKRAEGDGDDGGQEDRRTAKHSEPQ